MALEGSQENEASNQINGIDEGAESKDLLHSQHKPRLLLMGLKRRVAACIHRGTTLLIIQCRSGKSSISNVVFRKMAPQETLFLETTTNIRKEAMQ